MAIDPGRCAAAVDLLVARGAGEIAHPGGTLLVHLRRVHTLLGQWGARPALRLAGLCHAFYGTDGFPVALGPVSRRQDLADVIGAEAEALVYLYGSCDRGHSYPRLAAGGEAAFRDRFTGALFEPPRERLRDFAEITVANELDIVGVDQATRERYGTALLGLFTSWRPLLGDPARRAIETTLP